MKRVKSPKRKRYVYYYLITNLTDGRQYVGSRFRNGMDPVADGYFGSSIPLRKDMKRLGLENFTKEILSEEPFVDSVSRDLRESEFINQYHTLSPCGYNQYDTGRCPGFSTSGVKMTVEQRIKHSAKAKEQWEDTEFRDKMIALRNSPEFRAKMSATKKAMWKNHEYRDKMISASNKPEVKAKRSAAMKITMNKPEVRAKHSAAMKIAHNKPEVRAKHSVIAKAMWNDSEVRAKRRAGLKRYYSENKLHT